jgi:hypothetical protein
MTDKWQHWQCAQNDSTKKDLRRVADVLTQLVGQFASELGRAADILVRDGR